MFSVEAVLFFSLGGMLASFLGRTFQYIGIFKVGVSVTSSIIGSSTLFAAITAFLLLDEVFGSLVYLGIALVVSGIVLLSRKTRGRTDFKWKSIDVIWALLASICYGSSATIRKIGLNFLDHPIFGATIGVSASLGSYVLFLTFSKRVNSVFSSLNGRSLVFFILSGICTSLAYIFSYTAISIGSVTVVSSLVSTYPLFALTLSHTFLKEKVATQTLVGSVLVIFGAVMILAF